VQGRNASGSGQHNACGKPDSGVLVPARRGHRVSHEFTEFALQGIGPALLDGLSLTKGRLGDGCSLAGGVEPCLAGLDVHLETPDGLLGRGLADQEPVAWSGCAGEQRVGLGARGRGEQGCDEQDGGHDLLVPAARP